MVSPTAMKQFKLRVIGQAARNSEVNHIDETSYSKKNVLQWLWVMTNAMVAFFMIHPNRSKEAFKALIGDWVGILVSDGYGLYRIGKRGRCPHQQPRGTNPALRRAVAKALPGYRQ